MKYTAGDARSRLKEVLDAAERGEEVLITRGSQIFRLVPYEGGGEKTETIRAELSELDKNQLKYIENLVVDLKNIVTASTPRKVAGGVPRRESRVSTEPDWGA